METKILFNQIRFIIVYEKQGVTEEANLNNIIYHFISLPSL
jgi:hypothetical protein